MIDEKILDEVLPLPTLEGLKDEKVAELKAAGFSITNFASGGVFYGLLMIACQIRIELVGLLRTALNSMFVSHAAGTWLDLKAADYSKIRKEAIKARGYITLSRPMAEEAVKIPKGQVFKTQKDINGEELRYFVLEDTVLQKGALTAQAEVEAEKAGARYNVPPGQIIYSLTHIEGGVDTITNGEGWLTLEGADLEDDDSLRTRALRSWSELARVPIRDTYLNVCEAVPGVLYAQINDQHPRGQGTIDIIITSPAGAALEELLAAVREACEEVKEPDTDILVKSSVTVTQPVALTVTLPTGTNEEGVAARITASVTELMQIRKDRALNELTHADLIFCVKRDVPAVRNVTVTKPASDLFLDNDKVIIPGEISVQIEGT